MGVEGLLIIMQIGLLHLIGRILFSSYNVWVYNVIKIDNILTDANGQCQLK